MTRSSCSPCLIISSIYPTEPIRRPWILYVCTHSTVARAWCEDPLEQFIADRPPAADAIPMIAKALSEEIKYKISDKHVERGSATILVASIFYFSHIINFPFTHSLHFPPRAMKAKIIAKMGHLIEIKEELQRLKSGGESLATIIEEAKSAAAKIGLQSTLNSLRDP